MTVIYNDRATQATSARIVRGDLWLSSEDLTASTGWERKPQGMCLAERCVPLSPARALEFADGDGFNLSAFARFLAQPVVYDDAAAVVLFGEAADARGAALAPLDAPEFRLPDLDGTSHALSDYRGKKILLLSWASW